jgi:hypothetical protein
MVKFFDLLKKGYKYLSTQDAPLWRTLLFVFKAKPKTAYDFIFVKNSGANLPTTTSIDPHDLCHDISNAINIDEEELWKYHEEFISDDQFHTAIEKKLHSTSERPNELPEYGWREFLFIVVRAVKPNIMIETGSFDGLSTAIILLAMVKNNKGTLFTIDLPNPRLPSDIKADPAWIVPDYLRNRLQLKIGKSSEHLESIITEVGEVDLFYHDSWHTYENLMFEYQTVWSALSINGLLMSEYLPDLNNAVKDFIKDKTNKPTILANNTQFILQKGEGE